jgi:hypothetical protein
MRRETHGLEIECQPAGVYTSPAYDAGATEEEISRQWEQYWKTLAVVRFFMDAKR